MKLLSEILKPVAVVVAGIAAVLIITAMLVQDKVAGIVLKSLSNDISTKFETGSVRLSFLRRFPRATLDLKNVLVHSSPGFDRSSFGKMDTDTLLAARSVIMEFRLMDIIRGHYNIGRIGVRNGSLRILTDTSGGVNYEIRSVKTSSSDNDLIINLESINVTDVRALYNNRATELIISGMMDNGRLKSKISGDNIDFTGRGNLTIDLFSLYNFNIRSSIRSEIDVDLNSSEKGIRFDKSTLILDKNKFGIEGSVSANNLLDLSLTGDNINLTDIKKYLPPKVLDKLRFYNPTGILNIESKIKGEASRTTNPGIEISFTVNNGRATYGSSSLALKDVSFMGLFSNGTKTDPSTSSLKINNFRGTLGSSLYSGSLTITDFRAIKTNIELKGKVIPSEVKEFFGLKEISSPEGSVILDLRMSGLVPRKEKYSISDFLALDTKALMVFDSFGAGFRNYNIRIENMTGNLSVSDNVVARDLQFLLNEQDIKLNGTFSRLTEWLSGKPVIMTVKASIISAGIDAGSFLPEKNEKNITTDKPFSLPEDIILDLSFDLGKLKYKSLDAENVRGKMNYKPRVMTFNSVSLNSLDGNISGDGFLAQNADKSYMLKGNYNVNSINVKKTFSVFNNFGQDFIKDENLEGILSGSLTILIPMDQHFRPSLKALTAEGKYILKNGALVNFEPVKELSEFIDISELENIRFEELANDFFIRNNALYIPQMDVRSSAADLSVNGRHGFDNDYEYHVKILLSEILSKKIPKPRPNTTEFGAVNDDGLGRTSLLLRIEDNGDNVKVGYDVKAAGTQVRNEIKKEKQTLRTILNEEYGWYKYDTAAAQKPSSSGTRKFRVTWEERDSVRTERKEQPAEEKDNPLKNLFKKK